MSFQVDIDLFSGPLDLLLHIVRREELDLARLPLAAIIDQYLDYLEVLVELEIDDVADFLDVASLLIELKSKQAVPTSELPSEGSDRSPVDELGEDLVERLVQYKQIRDAASVLDDQSRRWQLRYSRLADDLPVPRLQSDQQPIEPIEIWDLVSAFGRILRERQAPKSAEVIYDDTPIYTYMQRIHGLIRQNQQVELTSLFEGGMHKSALVALFLATLELTRHYGVSTRQAEPSMPLYLTAGPNFQPDVQLPLASA
ncbi:MAG: segregation/condensation protein A [Pirellulaceae bacterium]|nr:segregation/condensation protein A [Pirellulaceae bacterium]